MVVNLRAGEGPGARPLVLRARISPGERDLRARDGNVEGGTREGASRTNAVLVGDDLPELGTDLVAALATLDCDDLTHGYC